MVIINRAAPLFGGLAIFGIFELFIRYYLNVFAAVLLSLLALALVLWQLHNRRFLNKDFWNFFITPSLFLIGSFLFILFLESDFLKNTVVVLTVFLLIIFLNNIFLYRFRPFRYRAYSLESVAGYLNLIAFWFWFTALFGFIILVDVPIWLLSFLALAITAAFYYSACWAYKLQLDKIYPYILIISLVMSEVFVSLSFLPTSFYVNGMVAAGLYYMIAGLSRSHILGNLEKKVFLKYTLFGLIIITLVLFTAHWT